MKKSMHWWLMAAAFALFFFPMAQVASTSSATLEIVEPAAMQTLDSSNVWIAIRFNFDMETDPKPFQAWLNGKPVGSLFRLTDNQDYKALITAGDGLKASVNGPRMNVFAAEVEGQNHKKFRQDIQFLVDCSGNHTPIAGVSADDHVFTNETVQLDGSSSFDEDGDPLAYRWSFLALPKKSQAVFSDPSSVNPSFVPDMPGTYVAVLVVDDYKAKSAPQAVTITVETLKILVSGTVEGPIFDRIRNRAIVDLYDGSQRPIGYHLVILDGDTNTPEEIRANALVREAFVEGIWVLALNVTEDQKTNGLSPLLSVVKGDRSTAYLFRRFTNSQGIPIVRIFELSPLSRQDIVDNEIPPDILATETLPEDSLRYAGIILKTLRESRESPLRSVMAPAAASPIPDGLINSQWIYSVAKTWSMNYSKRQASTKGRVQHGSHHVNYTFTLFLDNGNNPTGSLQYLLLEVDGEGNPNDAGSSFIATQDDMNKNNEFAWFQDQMTVNVTPSDSFWIWVANDPTSPNPTTTYTSSSSFSVSYSKQGGAGASYTHENSTSYSLTDWGVSCDSSGNYMSWNFRSQNPSTDEARKNGSYFSDNWFYSCGKPKDPNGQSLHQTQYHASVVWRTPSVKNQIANISTSGAQSTVNTACTCDFGTTCCCGDMYWHHITYNISNTFGLDLGVVIPVDIGAITFNQTPALVGPYGGTIKGSVVLKSPAKIDTQILSITSTDPIHVTPKIDRVTISKGKQAATFDVDVNAGGYSPGAVFFGGISAFYAKGYTQQFAMKAVNPADLKPPATTSGVSSDYTQWGGTTSTTGNWVQGFLVRYAVSFVYPSGESALGPWSDWIGPGDHYAMPLVINIPTDTTNAATARKIYRQFFANYQTSDPTIGVSLVGTLSNNTSTTYLDKTP